ncbi:MAG TPA: hypothetical protein RMH99_32420 [Sandaracinaceae bacterium LLY-WYZ-13_1]|nr:hypothetical protein [Sandaracinaceae bacterium LLY-WYZ-13_1]
MTRRIPVLAALLALGCAPSALDDAVSETGVEGPFDEVPADGKYDGSAARGPRVADGAATEVWSVRREWTDVSGEAGIAWEADSGLDWEQKFDAWVASMETEPRRHGSGDTFVVTTPHGERRFHAPTLECAEVAYLLRAAFASWYHLPFYVQGWDAHTRQTMYAGHFGFVSRDGDRVGRFPSFRTAYRDYEDDWSPGEPWPSDARLRGYRLGDDDAVDFLSEDGEEVGAGAYFDELFLNKRVGYFMRLLLLYFGSANLADGANTYHVRPEAIAPGDILVKRWQRRGIGHVMPVMQVERHAEDALEVSIASGSMPRREPLWEDPNRARGSFTAASTGGEGESSDGEPYAELGGGLRRWRTAVRRSGRWRNEVIERDREDYINDRDYEAIAARPARFEEILRSLSAAERRDVALAAIESAREHLRSYPASCAARIRREDAFDELYDVMAEQGMDRAAVDATYRTLEDYVFAALVYEESRTCCWNRSTGAMYDIIMDYAEAEQAEAEASAMCSAPTVFRAEADGYARWRDHAASLERGDEWNAWSEDESCSQRDVPQDLVDAERAATGYCALGEPTEPTEPMEPTEPESCDPAGGASRAVAAPLAWGTSVDARLCADEEDWFRVDAESEITVRIDFEHDDGDLDLELLDTDGASLGTSTSVQDTESVTASGPLYVRVYGYRGAANAYTITLE